MERGGQGEPLPRLHLHAVNADDLEVLSAALVSTTVKRADLGFQKARRRLAFVGNRFRWEDPGQDRHGPERVQSLLVFDNVLGVASQGVNRSDSDMVLSLLAVAWHPGDDGARVGHQRAGDVVRGLQPESQHLAGEGAQHPPVRPPL